MSAVCLSDLSNAVFNEFLVIIEDELRAHGQKVFLGVAFARRSSGNAGDEPSRTNCAGLLHPTHDALNGWLRLWA